MVLGRSQEGGEAPRRRSAFPRFLRRRLTPIRVLRVRLIQVHLRVQLQFLQALVLPVSEEFLPEIRRSEMSLSGYDDFNRSLVADASLHPPAIHGQGPDAGVPTPASVLLDFTAYIDGRPNATTAWSKTRGGHRISVTFWPAQPPRVSYFTVSCPDLKPGDFAEEPVVMATEDDVVLLCVVLGTRAAITKRECFDYFVYQAGGCGMPSSLKLLKHPGPSRIFHDCNVGILRCRGPKLDDGLPTLRSHSSKGDGFYVIAALYSASMVPGRYELYTYDSRTEEWATKVAWLRQEQELGHHSSHKHTKVITVGGKAGTMGWVDLWQGILFCDVLRQEHTVPLCYVALPAPLNPDIKPQGGPRVARDIAVVNGCIKYVELQIHVRPGSVADGDFITDDWTAATWSRKATGVKSLEKGSWQPGCKVHASQISARKNLGQFELLPKLVDDQGAPQPTLERLHTAHPTLSLHEDNVVYFMTKIHFIKDTKAWVLAIDAKKKTLQGVAEFDARRTLGMSFTYMCSSISQHLHMAPATHGHLKRPGMLMWQSSLKKQARDSEKKHQESEAEGSSAEGTSLRALDEDNMDLDK